MKLLTVELVVKDVTCNKQAVRVATTIVSFNLTICKTFSHRVGS